MRDVRLRNRILTKRWLIFCRVGVLLFPQMTPIIAAPLPQNKANATPASGRYVFVANLLGRSISQFRITPSGKLSPLIPPMVSCGSRPISLTLDPSRRYLYALSGGENNIFQYRVGRDGQLSPMPLPFVPTKLPAVALVIPPDAHTVYVLEKFSAGTGGIFGYSVKSGGAITGESLAVAQIIQDPITMATDSTGHFMYVLTKQGVLTYEVSPDRPWKPPTITRIEPSSLPTSMTIHPGGKFLYILTFSGAIFQFRIDGDGTLGSLFPASLRQFPTATAMAIEPSGRFAYVVDKEGSIIYEYAVEPSGVLRLLHPSLIPSGNKPAPIINPNTGQQGFVSADTFPVSITIDPTGCFSYVANESGFVSQYGIQAHGSLTFLDPPTLKAGAVPFFITCVSR